MQLSTHIYQYKLISPAKHAVITPVLLGIKTKSLCFAWYFHQNLVITSTTILSRSEGRAATLLR